MSYLTGSKKKHIGQWAGDCSLYNLYILHVCTFVFVYVCILDALLSTALMDDVVLAINKIVFIVKSGMQLLFDKLTKDTKIN